MNHTFLQHREQFKTAVARRYGVSERMYEEVTAILAPLALRVSLRKGELLQRGGTPAQCFHWLYSGVARAGFVTEAGTEVTSRFWMEGEAAASHEDLLRARDGLPATQFVVAETALQGYRLEWAAIRRLAERHNVLRDYYVKVSESSILRQGRRLVANSASAQGRLRAFRLEYPGLEARISQKTIASFLGITPQYMSQLLRLDGVEK